MEEITNMSLEDVQKIIGSFPIKPYRNNLIITVNVEEADGDLVLTNALMATTQYVVAIGNYHSNKDEKFFTPGDKILLDLERMMVFEKESEDSDERIGRIKLTPIEVDDVTFAIISDNVVLAKDER